MTYDSIDTNENDSSADRKITIDEINGADTSAASNGELLGSDGSGNLQFTSPPSGGDSFLNSGSNITIQTGSATGNGTLHSFNDAIVYTFAYKNNFGEFENEDNRVIVNFTDNTSITFDDRLWYFEKNSNNTEGSTQLFHNYKNVSSIQAASNFSTLSHQSICIFEEI